jgi:hypothetical protein
MSRSIDLPGIFRRLSPSGLRNTAGQKSSSSAIALGLNGNEAFELVAFSSPQLRKNAVTFLTE